MRHVRLVAVSSIALLASCKDQPIPSGPDPTRPSFGTYTASAGVATVLGGYNGSTYAIPYGINNLGVIVGVSDPSHLGGAVRWGTGTAAAPASTTAILVATGAEGRDVNALGQIAGQKGAHAALWTPNGAGGYTLTDIGGLGLFSGAWDSEAFSLNAGGQVVGVYHVLVGGVEVEHCFLWTPTAPNATTGTAVELPGLGGGGCVATDINSAGQVVGVSSTGGFGHAFVWSGGATIDLQAGAPATDASLATAINDAGQVAGYHITPSGSFSAAIWTPSGPGTWSTAFDLGAPALSGQSGTIHSVATDINDAGFVVGYTQDPVNAYRAFFWQSGTFTELAVPASDIGAPVEAHALTNLIGNVAIVTGGDTFDPDNNGRHALRWAVTLTPVGLEGCFAQLAQLLTDLQTGGVLSAGESRSLLSKVDAAFRQASQGRTTPARNLLNNIIAEVNQLRASGRLTDAQAQALTDSAQCAIAAL